MTVQPKSIASLQNDRIKAIRALEMRKERKETGLFVAYAVMLRRRAGASAFLSAIGIPAIASVPMAVAVILAGHQSLFLSIALGAVTYAVALAAVTVAIAPSGIKLRPKEAVLAFVRPPS